MNKFVNILFCLMICSLSLAQTQGSFKVDYIRIEGNNHFSRKEILTWAGLQVNSVYTEADFIGGMKNALQKIAGQGYYFAAVDSLQFDFDPDSASASVVIYLDEGTPLHLSSVEILDKKDLLPEETLYFPIGEKVYQDNLDQSIEEILLIGENQGFAFNRLNLQDYYIKNTGDSTLLTVTFKYKPGPLVTIDTIIVLGNKTTRSEFILRESRLKPGMLYSPERMEKAQKYLQRTKLFAKVKPVEIFAKEGSFIAGIEVIEKRYNSLDGAIGYIPNSDENKGYWTGLVDIALNNLFGTGRKFLIHWEQPDRNSQDIALSYKEPWIANLPLDVSVSFSQSVYAVSTYNVLGGSNRFLNRSGELQSHYWLTENIEISAGVEQTETIPDSLSRYVAGIPHSLSRGLQGKIVFEARDEPINPRSGYMYATSVHVAQKKNYVSAPSQIPSYADENIIKMELEYAMSVISNGVIFIRTRGETVDSDQEFLPVSELFYLGGANSLRGYRENQFAGSTVAFANLEFRWLTGKYSRVTLFNDWGCFERTIESLGGEPVKQMHWRYSYGLGITMETNIGIIGIDYAISQYDTPAQGKFHFRLKNEF